MSKSDNEDQTMMMSDMYAMGNHELDCLLCDSDEEVPAPKHIASATTKNDSNQERTIWDRDADGFQSDTSSRGNVSGRSYACVGSEDESAKMLLESYDKEMKPNSGRSMKQSLARKLMGFGVDRSTKEDLCEVKDDPFVKGDGVGIGAHSRKTIPLKWLSKRGSQKFPKLWF